MGERATLENLFRNVDSGRRLNFNFSQKKEIGSVGKISLRNLRLSLSHLQRFRFVSSDVTMIDANKIDFEGCVKLILIFFIKKNNNFIPILYSVTNVIRTLSYTVTASCHIKKQVDNSELDVLTLVVYTEFNN